VSDLRLIDQKDNSLGCGGLDTQIDTYKQEP